MPKKKYPKKFNRQDKGNVNIINLTIQSPAPQPEPKPVERFKIQDVILFVVRLVAAICSTGLVGKALVSLFGGS